MKTTKKMINVNEIKEIIKKAYGYKSVVIRAVDVGDIDNQYTPRHVIVDVGGILTLYVEIEEEEKNEHNCKSNLPSFCKLRY